jgi:predicted enzyme related to lactoylglutathione lyase
MINYRVENLDEVLASLRAGGCPVDDRIESSEFGRFGWVSDPEGNRLELWEPPRAAGSTNQ